MEAQWPTSAKYPLKAVVILAADSACAAARQPHSQCLLSRTTPRLPLPECTQQDACQCKYRHLDDRRGPQRRIGDDRTFCAPLSQSGEQLRSGERRECRR